MQDRHQQVGPQGYKPAGNQADLEIGQDINEKNRQKLRIKKLGQAQGTDFIAAVHIGKNVKQKAVNPDHQPVASAIKGQRYAALVLGYPDKGEDDDHDGQKTKGHKGAYGFFQLYVYLLDSRKSGNDKSLNMTL